MPLSNSPVSSRMLSVNRLFYLPLTAYTDSMKRITLEFECIVLPIELCYEFYDFLYVTIKMLCYIFHTY